MSMNLQEALNQARDKRKVLIKDDLKLDYDIEVGWILKADNVEPIFLGDGDNWEVRPEWDDHFPAWFHLDYRYVYISQPEVQTDGKLQAVLQDLQGNRYVQTYAPPILKNLKSIDHEGKLSFLRWGREPYTWENGDFARYRGQIGVVQRIRNPDRRGPRELVQIGGEKHRYEPTNDELRLIVPYHERRDLNQL